MASEWPKGRPQMAAECTWPFGCLPVRGGCLFRYDPTMPRRPKIVLPILIAWLVLAGLFVTKLGGGGQDDMFVTYHYARSVAHREDLVFNSGERHFEAPEPGMALPLAGV